jgi:hypothetical protein
VSLLCSVPAHCSRVAGSVEERRVHEGNSERAESDVLSFWVVKGGREEVCQVGAERIRTPVTRQCLWGEEKIRRTKMRSSATSAHFWTATNFCEAPIFASSHFPSSLPPTLRFALSSPTSILPLSAMATSVEITMKADEPWSHQTDNFVKLSRTTNAQLISQT